MRLGSTVLIGCSLIFYLYKYRYRLSGLIIPSLKDWFESTFGANLQHKTPATVSVT